MVAADDKVRGSPFICLHPLGTENICRDILGISFWNNRDLPLLVWLNILINFLNNTCVFVCMCVG